MKLTNRIAFNYKGLPEEVYDELFAAMGLPSPQYAEYRECTDSGFLVFLKEGCILRLRPKTQAIPAHPYILAPIDSRTIGNIVIDFMPGVNVRQARLCDAWKVQNALIRNNINFWDGAKRNIGLLPNGQPVVIDIGAVKNLTSATNYARKAMGQKTRHTVPCIENVQDKIFGELRRALNDAWPHGQFMPDAAKMKNFWTLMQKKTDEGLLRADWMTGGKMSEIAKNYDAKRCLSSTPITSPK